MMKLKKTKLLGGRILKTGLSVFLTAGICLFLQLPAIYAVVTAIVSTEPTAADSIRKGLIRLPASAIGAALSLTFTYFLGETAITYTMAAMLTILFCYKLKLTEGILVATLTAVAMVPATSDHFLIAFIARLGTTSIGIIVSSLVNFLILPPKFSPLISENMKHLFQMASTLLKEAMVHLTANKNRSQTTLLKKYHRFKLELDKTLQLAHFQKEEFKYHSMKTTEIRDFHFMTKQLTMLQQIAFHLGNLLYVHETVSLPQVEKDVLLQATESVSEILANEQHEISQEHCALIKDLDQKFWEWKQEAHEQTTIGYHHHFSARTVILYEILSLHDILEDLEQMSDKHRKREAAAIAKVQLTD